MRLFIAIPLPDEARKQLVELQRKLAASKTRMKLVEEENLHMTMRFIGEGEPAQWVKKLDSIKEKQFTLVFDQVGTYSYLRKINVVWAGCDAPESLLNIHRVIGEGTLSPHVTLARVHGPPDDAFRSFLEEKPSITAEITRVQLMNSTLGPGGPRYEVVHEKTL